jgi:hypothetical protein
VFFCPTPRKFLFLSQFFSLFSAKPNMDSTCPDENVIFRMAQTDDGYRLCVVFNSNTPPEPVSKTSFWAAREPLIDPEGNDARLSKNDKTVCDKSFTEEELTMPRKMFVAYTQTHHLKKLENKLGLTYLRMARRRNSMRGKTGYKAVSRRGQAKRPSRNVQLHGAPRVYSSPIF